MNFEQTLSKFNNIGSHEHYTYGCKLINRILIKNSQCIVDYLIFYSIWNCFFEKLIECTQYTPALLCMQETEITCMKRNDITHMHINTHTHTHNTFFFK